jgi:hypothetical protein
MTSINRIVLRRLFAPAVAAIAWISPAAAQMQLPGAFNPTPAGTVSKPQAARPAGAKPGKKLPPAPPKVPSGDSLVGRTLMQNGRAGAMEFSKAGADLQLLKLKMAGDQIARSGEACEVDLSSAPVALAAADGRPAGLLRYKVELPACPFSLDILDGAVVAVREGGACEFKAADCRVDPAGLWGQPANEIGPQRTKDIEAERRRAEQTMRANFKAWVSSAGKDGKLVARIARTQAAFSSRREELCRAYARESQHGYCALVATEARSSAIAARILPEETIEEDVGARKSRKR